MNKQQHNCAQPIQTQHTKPWERWQYRFPLPWLFLFSSSFFEFLLFVVGLFFFSTTYSSSCWLHIHISRRRTKILHSLLLPLLLLLLVFLFVFLNHKTIVIRCVVFNRRDCKRAHVSTPIVYGSCDV